ncbi:unnamed protein product [Gadus morhua 'NCC']
MEIMYPPDGILPLSVTALDPQQRRPLGLHSHYVLRPEWQMYSGLAAVSSLHKRVQQQKKKKIAVSRSAPAPVDIRKADVMVFS